MKFNDFVDEDGYAFVCEYAFINNHLVYSVLVRRKVKESDFCPHLEYKGCDECVAEHNQMISDQWAEYYAGLL